MGYEVDFLPVGDSNGDAICVRYGSVIHVVDGGFTDTGRDVIAHVNNYWGSPSYIDNVILTHADNDHACGLIAVMEHFDVGTLWMNRPWQFAEEIVHNFHGNYTADGLRRAIRDAYPVLVGVENRRTKRYTDQQLLRRHEDRRIYCSGTRARSIFIAHP